MSNLYAVSTLSGEEPATTVAATGASPATPGGQLTSGTALPGNPLPGGDVLSRLGHELRSPLNGVIGLARVAQMKLSGGSADDAELLRLVELIQTNGSTLLTTLDRIVEVARLEAETTAPVRGPFDCRTAVADAVADLRPAAAARGRRLVVDLPTGTVPVCSQPTLLQRLLHELVDNAVKYSDGADVRITVRRAPGQTVRIDVSDDGPGIPAEEQGHLFAPFRRGLRAAKAGVSGSGLGLYLAARLAARCGATVQLGGERAGPGTTVTVHLVAPDEAVLR